MESKHTKPVLGGINQPPPSLLPPKKRPYPFYLGGVAASIAGAVTHPLDLTKVRMQVSGDKGMFSSMAKTVRNAGFRGLYDGLTGTLLRQMTYSMMRFAAYDYTKTLVHTGPPPIPGYKLTLAGAMAGGVAGFLGNPAELIMVRMQSDKAKLPELRHNYRNSIQGLYRMAMEEGVGSWARGIGPNTARAILMNASQIPAYDWSKDEMVRAKIMQDGPVLHFVASLFAGTVATTVCSPADVLKSRIMSAKGNTSVMSVIRTSLANEGPMFIFKGWVPAWARLQPTTIIIFQVLEQLKRAVDVSREKGSDLF